MEKEMMDKINEVLKANGKRELSLDEMDKVSGGADTFCGMNEREMYDMFMGLTEQLGFDYAYKMFVNMTGYVTFGPQPHLSGTDLQKMDAVLYNFWHLTQDKNGKGNG